MPEKKLKARFIGASGSLSATHEPSGGYGPCRGSQQADMQCLCHTQHASVCVSYVKRDLLYVKRDLSDVKKRYDVSRERGADDTLGPERDSHRARETEKEKEREEEREEERYGMSRERGGSDTLGPDKLIRCVTNRMSPSYVGDMTHVCHM